MRYPHVFVATVRRSMRAIQTNSGLTFALDAEQLGQRRPAPHYRHLKVQARDVDQEEPWPLLTGTRSRAVAKCRHLKNPERPHRIESAGSGYLNLPAPELSSPELEIPASCCEVCNSCVKEPMFANPELAQEMAGACVGEARITVAEPGVAGAPRGHSSPNPELPVPRFPKPELAPAWVSALPKPVLTRLRH